MKKYIIISTGKKRYVFDAAKVSVHRLNALYQQAKDNGIRWNVDYLG